MNGFAFAGNEFETASDGDGYFEPEVLAVGAPVGDDGGGDGADAVEFDQAFEDFDESWDMGGVIPDEAAGQGSFLAAVAIAVRFWSFPLLSHDFLSAV